MKIEYSRRFLKEFRKLRSAEQERFDKRLEIWKVDPRSKLLRVHVLSGKYAGFYSFNVGGDMRALYKVVGDTVYLFDFIGTHSQLYG